jgi:hypothetical protein
MIRARFPLIPIPTFTFGLWISLLVLGIVLLFMFAPLAFRAFRPLVLAAFPLAIMVGVFNAALHIGSSIYMRRWMPGVYSAPVLLIAASLLLSAGWRLLRIHAATPPFRSNRGAG